MGATLILLAEISDKMPSIPEIWLWFAIPTFLFAAVALTDRDGLYGAARFVDACLTDPAGTSGRSDTDPTTRTGAA